MCCRRRQNRAPAVVTLSKMVYDKYQVHQAQKQAIARGSSPDPNFRRLASSSFSEEANNEILEKAGVEPPSYDEVVNLAVIPIEPAPPFDSKQGWVRVYGEEKLPRYDNLDSESLHEVSGGLRAPVRMANAMEGSSTTGSKGACQSRWQLKKAEWAIKRAERRARGGGCCC